MADPILFVNTESLPIQDEPEEFRQFVYDWDMLLIMNDERMQTIEQARQFLEGGETVEFRGLSKGDQGGLLRFARNDTGERSPRIGERAKPDPKGQPGYIRIDTVHQGDLNGHKGVYHSPNQDPGTPVIMDWWRPRMAQWCAKTWDMPISRYSAIMRRIAQRVSQWLPKSVYQFPPSLLLPCVCY